MISANLQKKQVSVDFGVYATKTPLAMPFTDESNSKLFSHPVTDFPEVLPAYQQFCEIDLRAPVGTPSVAYFLKIESYILDSFFMGVHGGFLTMRCFGGCYSYP